MEAERPALPLEMIDLSGYDGEMLEPRAGDRAGLTGWDYVGVGVAKSHLDVAFRHEYSQGWVILT